MTSPTRVRPAREALSRRTVTALVVAALAVPALATIGRAMLALAHPDDVVPAYVVHLCRRALCDADSPTLPGAVEASVLGGALLVAWLVAAVALAAALRTRRSRWIAMPSAVTHAVLAVLLWNPVAFALSGGAWWGQVLVIVWFLGVPIGVRLLAMRALGERSARASLPS